MLDNERPSDMRNYTSHIQSHLNWFIENGTVIGYGPDDNAMWMSSLDLYTSRHPESWERPEGIEKRCYRWIESPDGSNLYWDQPLLVVAHHLGGAYATAADGYVRDFLARSVAPNGLFLWGNHYYYHAIEGHVVFFGGGLPGLTAVDPATQDGAYHETRPLPVAWNLLWRLDEGATIKSIRAQGEWHVVDAETGEHNRHADQKRGHAFLESGAILAETLCWLAKRSGDTSLTTLALKVATFNFKHRNEETGLLSNSPTKDRWDMHMVTSEVGMWANCLMRCYQMTGEKSFAWMARSALGAWLDLAWDASAHNFYGKLMIEKGTPVLGAKTTQYQPADYCDLWEPLFPAHDYPMPNAEACLLCYQHTGDERFLVGLERWVMVIQNVLPAPRGYAEHYGRCIHLLCEAADVLGRPKWRDLAGQIADEAVDVLWVGDRFRSHVGEDRCDAVDGLGFLFLALLRLESGEEPDLMGLHF